MRYSNTKQITRLIHSSHSYNKQMKSRRNEEKKNKRENLYRDIFLFRGDENDSSSENDENSEINITIYYDGREILIKFNKNKTFSEFTKFLQKKYFKVGFEENYQLFYENKEIPMNDKRKIKNIVNLEDSKINKIKFILKSKGKSFINSKLKKMYIELENIPSFMDLSNQINNFINSQKKIEINFDIVYKDNSCRILFSSSEIAFSFIAYMTNIKFTNKFYKKLKIDIKYNALERNIFGNNKNFRGITEENIIINNKTDINNKNISKNKIKDKNKNKSRNIDDKIIQSYTESNIENKKYGNYSEDNYESIRDSTPYGYENQLAKMEEIMNKNKWVGNKNFFTSINKHSFNRMISPNRYYLKKLRNITNKNKISNKVKNKNEINLYTQKIYKLKISDI